MPVPDHLWDEHEVARYLNISNWTVRTYRQQGKLGYTQIGTVIRYVPEEVKAFAVAGRKAPRCPDCGNNAHSDGLVRLPDEVDPGEPKFFSDLQEA